MGRYIADSMHNPWNTQLKKEGWMVADRNRALNACETEYKMRIRGIVKIDVIGLVEISK